MAGLELPLIPTEHQYFVTETVPELAEMDRRLPSVADRDGEYYLRQEGNGLLVGAYERDMRFWAEEGTLSASATSCSRTTSSGSRTTCCGPSLESPRRGGPASSA